MYASRLCRQRHTHTHTYTSQPAPQPANRTLYRSDNLPVLQGMDSETVDLIATDPPFNKSRDFHVTPALLKGQKIGFKDRWAWDRDVHQEWVDEIQDTWPASWKVINSAKHSWGEDMAAYLCWLGVRVMEMHRLLKPTGSLYLHIDHTAHAYVKTLLDSIFGRKNFRNEIVWCYTGPSNTKRWFPRKHDTVLLYVKSSRHARFFPDAVRVPYVKHETGKTSGIFKKPHTMPETGKVIEDWWADITPVGRIAKERVKYPTQKPLALYRRIVKASSAAGDMVLDPFCGCATTPIAAEMEQREWVGIDIWEGAFEMLVKRLLKQGLTVPEASEDAAIAAGVLHLQSGRVNFTDRPPTRTDGNETAAPSLRLRTVRATAPWQKLTKAEIRAVLGKAQTPNGKVWCAGCGRELEPEFMHLDHVSPKSQGGVNFITNRVLICAPCNGRKGNRLTIVGLHAENRKTGWMHDHDVAKKAFRLAQNEGARVRDDWEDSEVQCLLADVRAGRVSGQPV